MEAAISDHLGDLFDHLGDISQVLDDEVEGFMSVPHPTQHKNLFSHQPFPLAELVSRLETVALAADQKAHQPLRLILGVQLHLSSRRASAPDQ